MDSGEHPGGEEIESINQEYELMDEDGPAPEPENEESDIRTGADDDRDTDASADEAVSDDGHGLLRAIGRRAWSRYAKAFSEARRGPSEQSIQELRSYAFGLLAALDILKSVGAIDGTNGLRQRLTKQMETAQLLRDVQLRLHGAEALVADFPQLDSFREEQFGAQTQAVQETLRAFGKVKLAALENRFNRLEAGLDMAQLDADWRVRVLRRIEKRFADLVNAIEKLEGRDSGNADKLRSAFYKYCDLFLALDGLAVAAGDEDRLAFRFADAAFTSLAETDAVLSGLLADDRRRQRESLGPVIERLREIQSRRRTEVLETAGRLADYPPVVDISVKDGGNDFIGTGKRELYVLRHAEAVTGDTPGFENDRDRALTPQGIRLTKRAAAGMRALGIGFDLIFTSPLVRARDTAAIVANGTRFDGEVVETETLSPGHDPQTLFKLLNDSFHSSSKILVVGHQPDLGSLISILTTGDLSFSLSMKKGAICKIAIPDQVAAGAASFEWLLTSKLLSQIR